MLAPEFCALADPLRSRPTITNDKAAVAKRAMSFSYPLDLAHKGCFVNRFMNQFMTTIKAL
jgi:hypothetical protein